MTFVRDYRREYANRDRAALKRLPSQQWSEARRQQRAERQRQTRERARDDQ